jgi:thiol-disulfide isomerase/thioredoxin
MLRKEILLFFALSALLCSIVKAQVVKPLMVGDTVPNIILNNIHNYKNTTAKISDFRGKLVILDFWATWCGSCIAAFPKMHEFQKKFPDQLQVILINAASTRDNEQKVNALFKRKKELTGFDVKLPYVLNETKLASLFPYRYVPHYIWIDKDGTVIAITASEEATENNIQALLDGKKPALHMKEDMFDFDTQKPLFVNGNGGNSDAFLYRSIISKYKEGLGTVAGSQMLTENRQRLFMINYPVFSLLQSAFPEELSLPGNRILYEGLKAASLKRSSANRDLDLYYCYELIMPKTSQSQRVQYIRSDIERFFQITVVRRRITTKCLVFTYDNKIKRSVIVAKDDKAEVQLDKKLLEKYIHNAPASSIVNYLNPFFDIPLVDETFCDQKVDITFDDLDKRSAIIKSLNNAGFIVSEGEREIEVAVIVDKN